MIAGRRCCGPTKNFSSTSNNELHRSVIVVQQNDPVERRALEPRLGLFGHETVIVADFETLVRHALGNSIDPRLSMERRAPDPFGGAQRVTGVAIERHSFSEFSHLLLSVLLTYHGQPILVRARSRTARMDLAKHLGTWKERSPEQWVRTANRYFPTGGTAILVLAIAYQLAALTWVHRAREPAASPHSLRRAGRRDRDRPQAADVDALISLASHSANPTRRRRRRSPRPSPTHPTRR